MNTSLSGQNVSTVVTYRDSVHITVAKNLLVVALGITINFINGTLVHTFRKHQVFYVNPRYILFIHLVINDMIQLASTISLFVLSYTKTNAFLCSIIVSFAVFTTLNSPFNLAVMAVECYIAVCFPLRHAEFSTIKNIYIVIACMWALSMLSIVPDLLYLLAINHTQMFYSAILCAFENLIQNNILQKKREILYIIYLISVWLVLIYTYFQIFFAARSATSSGSEFKKARNTILLHSFQLLLCMLTYVYPVAIRALLYMFPGNFLQVLFVWYVLAQILPRFVSPIVYGLRDTLFRQYLKQHLLCTVCQPLKL